MNACYQFLTIVRDHWAYLLPKLRKQLPSAVAAAAISAMTKAFTCRTEARGFIQYRCLDCGEMIRVPFACKSRWCPQCGMAKATEAAERAKSRLLNVRHRHLTFSVPAELRPLLFARRELLSVVAKAAVQTTIQAVGTRCRAFAPLPGVMATVHTYGRNLEWHVHVHVLCTEGGLRGDGVWQPVYLFPATQYRRLWQYWLLKLLRAAVKGDRSATWRLGRLYHTHPTGFIVNVMSRYANGAKAAAYCCRYTGRPPLSERRIVAYDGQQVSLSYTDYRDGQDKTLTLPAVTFLVRVLQHVWPRYQRDVHYHGLYHPPPDASGICRRWWPPVAMATKCVPSRRSRAKSVSAKQERSPTVRCVEDGSVLNWFNFRVSGIMHSIFQGRQSQPASCRYQCERCGQQETIPADVLAFFDVVDPGEPDAPATFRCQRCPGIMYPVAYLRAQRAAPKAR